MKRQKGKRETKKKTKSKQTNEREKKTKSLEGILIWEKNT